MNWSNRLTDDLAQFLEYVRDLEHENETLKEMNGKLQLDCMQKDGEIAYLEEKLSESGSIKISN